TPRSKSIIRWYRGPLATLRTRVTARRSGPQPGKASPNTEARLSRSEGLRVVAVTQHLIPDHRDGRCKHEDDEAAGHVDAAQHGDNGKDDDPTAHDEQPPMEAMEPPNQKPIHGVDEAKIDGHRGRDAEHGGERGNASLAFDRARGDAQAGAGRDGGGDDQHLAEAPGRGAMAMLTEGSRRREEVVEPPHAEGEPRAGDAYERRVKRPTMLLDYGRECSGRAHDPFAQRDEHEEAVPLHDVMRVPRRAAMALGE